ncbi:MAG: hypothetical protein A2428_15130 [Bdellovibrionales bacterium RIFOXYC1_FULL_54_43]|nr:MAG: hypothetical protein A2428_15130 [Bdellovibrionales bacterium RIFOXYC1_FULL_54_43]OFZ82272.1 MAG: hypothetical protein A2603_01135 [Bdellovibrionales bacterium RIFOXYD1_FULL_55_31]
MANTDFLLISTLPEDRAFAASAAESAGLTLITATTAKEGATIVAEKEPRVIFLDASSEAQYKEFETAIQETVGLFSDKINANAIHFLTSSNIEKVQYLIESPLFGHFIMRNYHDPVATGLYYGKILKATLSERAFGLNTLLPNAKVQIVKLQKTTQKQDAVEAVKNFFIAAKFQSRMATVIANAVDELLMNAMFDAPVDEAGRPLFNSMVRSTSMALIGRQSIEMHVGYDGHYAAITAVDLFGSLDKVKLLTHITKIYTEEEYKIRTSVAGAGIGLATVFRSGGSFFFVSESGVRTEVTVFFKRTDNFREFKDQFRFLSTQFYF